MSTVTTYFGDNLAHLKGLPSSSVGLIYIDPPYKTNLAEEVVESTENAENSESSDSNDDDEMGFPDFIANLK